MGFNPAHSSASFALVNKSGTVFPVPGPQPPFPVNAPCWLAKGPGSIWYSGNSPANAISIFFSDGHDTGIYSWDYLYDLGAKHDSNWKSYLARLLQAGKSRDVS